MKLLALGLLTAFLVAAGLAVAFAGTHDDHRHASPSDPDLAARINSACHGGDVLSDWTTGDDITPVPEGTVKVTCMTKDGKRLYYVAVAR